MEVPGGPETSSQIAQRIVLAGSDRLITQFELRMWALAPQQGSSGGDTSVRADLTLRLYSPFPTGARLPSQLLWEGTITDVVMMPTADALAGPVTVTFAPNVVVPDTLWFAISHANISNQNGPMGIAYELPTSSGIGAVNTTWALQDTNLGAWFPDFAGPSPTMQGRVTAIPSVFAAVPLGVLTLALAARRMRH
jgi:hypothetical protein